MKKFLAGTLAALAFVAVAQADAPMQCESIGQFLKDQNASIAFKGIQSDGSAVALVQPADGGPWALFLLIPQADKACVVASGAAGTVKLPGLAM